MAQDVEARSNIENPTVPVSAANFVEFFGLGSLGSASGLSVTIDTALGVPAFGGGVNFLSNTMASLPLHLYRRTAAGNERQASPLATLLHDAVNDETSSFAWRKWIYDNVFTGGRAVTFIERSATGRIMNLWPLDPSSLTVKREDGRKAYLFRDGGRPKTYQASEVIDITFMLRSDMVRHRGPIAMNRDVLGLAIAITQYASKFFQNGGVPPFAIVGKFLSPGAVARASADLQEAVKRAAREQRLALPLPDGVDIKPIGVDADKAQLIEAQHFIIEQIARILTLPPTFLQDLTHGTFSNTEQQDLHFVKHRLRSLATQFEQELNLKLFGRLSNRLFVELAVDALLRGDFKSRMEGLSKAVQGGVLMPNEARALENRPAAPHGNRLYMQGAMIPLGTTPTGQALPDPTPSDDGDQTNAA
jgi:HK97 family phage portal protein